MIIISKDEKTSEIHGKIQNKILYFDRLNKKSKIFYLIWDR
jgi:hypothetical protein